MENVHKCIIVGSGPAGYTAAIYASRAGLQPTLISGPEPGGQLVTTHEIENYPGFVDPISGFELTDIMRRQAEKFGMTTISGIVTGVDLSQKPYSITIDGGDMLKCLTLIIATGASAKYTGLAAEEKFKGKGVSACAVCDGFFYRKKDTIVVGGGDTAVGDALYLSKICNKVYLAVRKPYLRASQILQQRLKETVNIELLTETVVTDIYGQAGVEGVTVAFRKGTDQEQIRNIAVAGYFAAVGRQPQTDVFKPFVQTDQSGYIITEAPTTKTNIPGVFACGDCADPIYRQAVVAAGTGCRAALDAEKFLAENC